MKPTVEMYTKTGLHPSFSYQELFARNIEEFRSNGSKQAGGICPFHNDRRPSFSINLESGVWNCKSCKAKGNAFQFAEKLGLDPTPFGSSKTTDNDYDQAEIESRADEFYKYLVTNFKALKESGKIPVSWTLEAVKSTQTGYDLETGKLVFVHFDADGRLTCLQWHKGKQHGENRMNKLWPANLIEKYDLDSFLVFCEGCKDALTLISQGLNAVAATTGAGGIPKDLTHLQDFRKIYIVYDNDVAGIEGSQTLADKLTFEFRDMEVGVCSWGNDIKGYDVTDYFNDNTPTAFCKHLLNSRNYDKTSCKCGPYLKPDILKSPVFSSHELWHLYTFLLINASYKQDSVRWYSGKNYIDVPVKPGQLVCGRGQLAGKLGINPSTLRNRLARLQKLNYIEIRVDRRYSVVTICNYGD